jgi:hypothetical protein
MHPTGVARLIYPRLGVAGFDRRTPRLVFSAGGDQYLAQLVRLLLGTLGHASILEGVFVPTLTQPFTQRP